ncbi:hypothetical protein OMP38_24090 [Cohnella ginsengisoli]|uniref:RNA polymerase subunit sigma n=1 Tax=Cohnella ginsengisoli TaxID=425004 RepID=A0A9X4KKG4_9BACL|nr:MULTISPECIES: hypothetical protein [Cohnella]MDG0793570.1 hypothetical protein [Cohnella ginsengisoli]SFB57247.1 hypothetical protein SAMN05216312_11425 [Cohnella sp. OV330]
MSYKPIDVQTSIPRSIELTPLQASQQLRQAIDQAALGAQAQKLAERDAKRNAKSEGTGHKSISDEDDPKESRQKRPFAKKKRAGEHEQTETHAAEHPYKGHHIDLSL